MLVCSGRLINTLAVTQAVMNGAGVRTSAESWELNVCVPSLSCMWQVDGGHLHETCLNLSLLFIAEFRDRPTLLQEGGGQALPRAAFACKGV